MIAYLKGKIKLIEFKSVVVEINGLGYRVFLKDSDLERIKQSQEVEFFIHQHIREDISDLYGFSEVAELKMFKFLLSISGIGPKAGLSILNLATVKELRQAVIQQDETVLTRASGVGKKTAERIILELKSKLELEDKIEKLAPGDREVVDALVGLGYSVTSAREALRKVSSNVKNDEEKIKAALKMLGSLKI